MCAKHCCLIKPWPDVVISIHIILQFHHELDPSRCLREEKCLMVDHPSRDLRRREQGGALHAEEGGGHRRPGLGHRRVELRSARPGLAPDASLYGPRSRAASSQNASSAGRAACWPWRGAAATPTGVAPDSGAGRCSVWSRGDGSPDGEDMVAAFLVTLSAKG